jgi:hypothetical protein
MATPCVLLEHPEPRADVLWGRREVGRWWHREVPESSPRRVTRPESAPWNHQRSNERRNGSKWPFRRRMERCTPPDEACTPVRASVGTLGDPAAGFGTLASRDAGIKSAARYAARICALEPRAFQRAAERLEMAFRRRMERCTPPDEACTPVRETVGTLGDPAARVRAAVGTLGPLRRGHVLQGRAKAVDQGVDLPFGDHEGR